MWSHSILFGPHYNQGQSTDVEYFFDLCDIMLYSHHSVSWVQLEIILICLKKVGEHELFEVTRLSVVELSVELRNANSQFQTLQPKGGEG